MPSPLGFLRRPRPRHKGPVSLRQAQPGDYQAIEMLLAASNRAYSGAGGTMREALREDVALTAWQEERLAGFILAYQQGPAVAWIHGMGLAPDASQDTVGQALLQGLEERLSQRDLRWIGYMDEYSLSWVRRLLEQAGFRRNTRVVTYETPITPPPTRGNQEVVVRPAAAADIPAIALLDEAAFGPLWAYRERVFQAVLGHVAYFQVAELEGVPIGYILCTAYQHTRVHVVRLAVDPRRQGQGVAARLLAEAFHDLSALGIRWVSLNTQEENLRSQRLYRWFGFRPTGEDMAVWAKELGR